MLYGRTKPEMSVTHMRLLTGSYQSRLDYQRCHTDSHGSTSLSVQEKKSLALLFTIFLVVTLLFAGSRQPTAEKIFCHLFTPADTCPENVNAHMMCKMLFWNENVSVSIWPQAPQPRLIFSLPSLKGLHLVTCLRVIHVITTFALCTSHHFLHPSPSLMDTSFQAVIIETHVQVEHLCATYETWTSPEL